MSVGEFCNREVVVAFTQTSLHELAQLMREHHVGCVVIVKRSADNNIPIGIITDRDIVLELIAPGIALDSITAGDLIGTELITTREIDGIWETLQRMRRHGVRRIPVVNDEDVLVGILTVDDVLESLVGELNELVQLISREQLREKTLRTVP